MNRRRKTPATLANLVHARRDGGPDASDGKNAMLLYARKLLPVGTAIDAMIISHPHDDHYPGALGLLANYPVRDFYDSGYPRAVSSGRTS